MSKTCYAWDVKDAGAKAAELQKPVALTRHDGSSSGLCVLPNGQLTRATLKPLGKAARKEFKRLRRQISGGNLSPTVSRVLQRRMRNLCGLGYSASSATSALKTSEVSTA